MPPVFLDVDDILEIQQHLIERYGGEPGLRDPGLLQSAVAMPLAAMGGQFLHENLFLMAAAYLFHIVRNHPFVDGNKRAGTASALVFLELNGAFVQAEEDTLASFVIEVAEGKHEKGAIADFLRRHSVSSR